MEENQEQDLGKKLQFISEQEQKLSIEKGLIINKALSSDNPDAIFKAQSFLRKTQPNNQQDYKSIIYDPESLNSGGYKQKAVNISYEMLRAIGRLPIIKAIIETRKEQVIDFCEPQKDKYSTGFVIRPKNAKKTDSGIQLNKRQEVEIAKLTEFLLNCGEDTNEWHGDNFQSFTRKVIQDSLTLDQGTFEIVRTRGGDISEFFATDGASFRIADTFNNEKQDESYREKMVNKTLPFYVQLYNGVVVSEFYPWELCFGIRNPQSDIYTNGYGRSELEDLIETATSMLYADQYNANYFKVGSNPKGILRVTGNVNTNRLEEFKQHFQSQMTGVRNAHKLMVIESEKMDFINTQMSNKDMEFAKYQEYLIKIACAIYKIDPAEINFPLSGSSEAAPMFEGNNEARLKYSRDKGLKPLIKTYQHWLNKFVIGPKTNDQYELVFEGLDSESPEKELENDVKAVTNWSTVNEIRRKRGMEDIEGGDIILNPIFLQGMMMSQQGNQESNQYVSDYENGGDQDNQDSNPFQKALQNDLTKMFSI